MNLVTDVCSPSPHSCDCNFSPIRAQFPLWEALSAMDVSMCSLFSIINHHSPRQSNRFMAFACHRSVLPLSAHGWCAFKRYEKAINRPLTLCTANKSNSFIKIELYFHGMPCLAHKWFEHNLKSSFNNSSAWTSSSATSAHFRHWNIKRMKTKPSRKRHGVS